MVVTTRTTLVIERSHLRKGAVVLRDRFGVTLHSHGSARCAVRYCERNGYAYTFPLRRFEALLQEHGL